VAEVPPGPSDHLPLGVDADDVGPDKSGLGEQAAGAAHRVQQRPARAGAGDIGERPRQQRVHAPGLEERLVRRLALAEVPDALGGQPAQRADARLVRAEPAEVGRLAAREPAGVRLVLGQSYLALVRDADRGGAVVVVVARRYGEQGSQLVVRVLQVDAEAPVDQYRAEFPLGPGRVDAGQAPHVAGPDPDGALGALRYRPSPRRGAARALQRGGVQQCDGVLDTGRRPAEERGDALGVGQPTNPVGDAAGRREPRAQRVDGGAGALGLPAREPVVLATQFEDVHGRHRGRTGHEGAGPGAPSAAPRQTSTPISSGNRCRFINRTDASGPMSPVLDLSVTTTHIYKG
jgi:hypothetical protein